MCCSSYFRLFEAEGEVGTLVAASLLFMLKLGEGNVFSKSEQDHWTFILDTTATAAVVAKAIPVFILAHPVFDLSGLAAVQGNIDAKRTIRYATVILTMKCC